MVDNACTGYAKMPSVPESLDDEKSQSKAEKIIKKGAEALSSPALTNALKWVSSGSAITAGVVGWAGFLYMSGLIFNHHSTDPQHVFDRDVCTLFQRLLFIAPAMILFKRPRECFLSIQFIALFFLLPYSSIAMHTLSAANVASMETMTLLLECAYATSIIFLLPVYVIFIRNRKVEDDDNNQILRQQQEEGGYATLADLNAYVTPCCIYYALIMVTSVAATSIAHLCKIETMTILNSLTIISWVSFLACFPLHYSNTASTRQCLFKFFLVFAPIVVGVVILLHAYQICSAGTVIEGMKECQGLPWYILMAMVFVRFHSKNKEAKQAAETAGNVTFRL